MGEELTVKKGSFLPHPCSYATVGENNRVRPHLFVYLFILQLFGESISSWQIFEGRIYETRILAKTILEDQLSYKARILQTR